MDVEASDERQGGTATRKMAKRLTKRRESSRFWYGGLTGDEITPDRGRSGPGRLGDPAGSVHRDPLHSQLADRLEETYQRLSPQLGRTNPNLQVVEASTTWFHGCKKSDMKRGGLW